MTENFFEVSDKICWIIGLYFDSTPPFAEMISENDFIDISPASKAAIKTDHFESKSFWACEAFFPVESWLKKLFTVSKSNFFLTSIFAVRIVSNFDNSSTSAWPLLYPIAFGKLPLPPFRLL